MDISLELDYILMQQVLFDGKEARELYHVPVRKYCTDVDPFETLSEEQFINYFRMRKQRARELIAMLHPFIPGGIGSVSTTVEIKVLVALFFFGHGEYQNTSRKNVLCSLSQSSTSRYINLLADVLSNDVIVKKCIHFPQVYGELEVVRTNFSRRCNFPGVIGCVDSTHIAIMRPDNEAAFLNQQGYYSLNVQIICDDEHRIMHFENRFPGSVRDDYVWQQSNISTFMADVHTNIPDPMFFLLGDSSYYLRPWLITPVANALDGSPEAKFNAAHRETRDIVAKCIYLLKNRWRCLLRRRLLHYHPVVAAKIIAACCVLHNFCLEEPMPKDKHSYDPSIEEFENIPAPFEAANEDLKQSMFVRNGIISRYFT